MLSYYYDSNLTRVSDGSLFVLDKVQGVSMANQLVSAQLAEKVRQLALDAVENAGDGIELVDLTFYKQYGKLTLEAFLWKKGGICLDDCEKVHNLFSASLDSLEDEFADDYVLNVSSQGLDRKIVTDDDFRRALDTEIECVDAQKKKHHGILVSFDDQNVVVRTDEKKPKDITLKRNILTKVQPYVRF